MQLRNVGCVAGLSFIVGGCATAARGDAGVPIEAERVEMVLQCVQGQVMSEGYYIGPRDMTRSSVRGRREMEVGEEIEIDLISFRVSPSKDGAMLLARASVFSQSSFPDPANVSKRYLRDLPVLRPAARSLLRKLQQVCVRQS